MDSHYWYGETEMLIPGDGCGVGSGDGSINLFDVRTGGNIVRLPLSSTWEVTSVSFSSCETFFQASCTGNCTFIWDTRMMPLKSPTSPSCNVAPRTTDKPFRALHHLSHGDPMPTAENAFQVPGYFDSTFSKCLGTQHVLPTWTVLSTFSSSVPFLLQVCWCGRSRCEWCTMVSEWTRSCHCKWQWQVRACWT